MNPFTLKRTIVAALSVCALTILPLSAQDKEKEKKSAPKPRAEKPAPDRSRPTPPKPPVSKERGRSAHDAPKGEGRSAHESPKVEKRAWIGVAMAPVPQALQQHLELAEGFGIQVQQVMDGSPADKAGIRNHDILTKLNEQLLTTPEHLSLLVRSMKSGEEVSITYIRKGGEKEISLKLGETSAPLRARVEIHGRDPHQSFVHPRLPQDGRWSDVAREHQDRLQKMIEERKGHELRGARFEEHEKKGSSPGRPPSVSVRPGFPVQVVGSNAMVRIDNPKGEVTIIVNDGKHKITIKDDDGNEIFEGPYQLGKKDGGLPEKARDYLKEMKLEDLEVLLPKEPKKAQPEKTGGNVRDPKGKEKEGIL